MGREIAATTTVATLIFFWNMIVGGYDDFNQVHHDAILQSYYLPTIKLPMAPFTLAASSLGLLLGKRASERSECMWTPISIMMLYSHHTLLLYCSCRILPQHSTITLTTKVFRTNTAYQRWDEARKNWGMNM